MKPKDATYYDKLFATRSKYAASPEKTKYYPLWCDLAVQLHSRPIKSVLDIGCGTGQLGVLLEGMNRIRYKGFDFSATAVERAQEKGLSVWQGDVYDEENYIHCGAYLCLEVLEHLEDDLFVFGAAADRALYLFFSVPTFGGEAHVRRFPTEKSIRHRYERYCDGLEIHKHGKRFLCRAKL